MTFSMVGWRWRIAPICAAIALIAALALSSGPAASLGLPSSAAPATAMPAGPSASVVQAAARAPGRRIEVIARFDASIDPAHARAAVRAAGGTVLRDLPIIRALGVRMPAAAARDFAAAPGVLGVTLNARVKPSADAIDPIDDLPGLKTAYPGSVRAPRAWNNGYTGRGVAVAVIDTGIAGDMPDFRVSRTNPASRVVATAVLNPDATRAGDSYGHGTHVAGIIAGDSRSRPLNDPVRTNYRGIAPDADLVDVKVADDDGATSVIDVVYGLQFVADHPELGIRVVNLSLNARDAEAASTDPLDAAVEQLWLHGIVVVTAAGNRGDAPDAVQYAPANDPYAIAVGGVDDQGTKVVQDDQLASWSSRGVTQSGLAKPDVVAPGAHIVSTMAPGAAYRTMCPDCVRDSDYFQVGGTSQAAAVVSGTAALVLQAHPAWTPDMVKGVLIDQARDLPGRGHEVNAWRAILASDDQARAVRANAGLTPSTLIDPDTGSLDPTRATWSRATWSGAADALRATWSRATWSCTCDPMAGAPGDGDPARATWSRATWSRATWSRATWSSAFDK